MQVRSIISVFTIVCLVIVTFFCNTIEGGKLLERTNQKNNHRRENSGFVQRLKRRAANTYRRRKRDSDPSYEPYTFTGPSSPTEEQLLSNSGRNVLDLSNAKLVGGISTFSLRQPSLKRLDPQFSRLDVPNGGQRAQSYSQPTDNAYPDRETGDTAAQSADKPQQVFDESAQPPRQQSDEPQQIFSNPSTDSPSTDTRKSDLDESLAELALEDSASSVAPQLSETMTPPEDDPVNFASA